MAIWKFIKSLDSRFSWSFVGTIVGILGLILAYYSLRPRVTEITYDLTSETNVLDVHKQIDSLEVFFQNENIRDKGQNIKVFSFLIENTGDEHIKQVDFDGKENWGLQFKNGKIINYSLTNTSSDYLRNNLAATFVENNIVVLPKIMFDKGEDFSLDVVVLHDNNTHPKGTLIGKISGIEKYKSRNTYQEKKTETLWSKVFQGNLGIQLIRLVSFFIIGLSILITVVVVSEKWTDHNTHSLQRKREAKFESLKPGFPNTVGLDVLADIYVRLDKTGLKNFEAQFLNVDLLTEYVKGIANQEVEIASSLSGFYDLPYHKLPSGWHDFKLPAIINSLRSTGGIVEDGDQWKLSNEFKENLTVAIKGL